MVFSTMCIPMLGQSFQKIRLYNSVQGLSNNQVNAIFQDSKGLLWFATDDGLNRYDGYEFLVMRPDLYDSASIASGKIKAVAEDNQGNIWLATSRGISVYNLKENGFTNYKFSPRQPGHSNNEIFDLCFVNDSVLYGLGDSLLIAFNIRKSSFKSYPLKKKKNVENLIQSAALEYSEKFGVLFIGSSEGLSYLDTDKGEVRSLGDSCWQVNEIYIDENEEAIWLATSDGLVHCSFDESGLDSPVYEVVFKGLNISTIAKCVHNNILVGVGSRVIVYNPATRKVLRNKIHSVFAETAFDEICTIYIDRLNHIWIGTSAGIYQVNMNNPEFLYYNTISRDVTLSYDNITSILKTDDYLLIGSYEGGLEVLDKDKQIIASFSNHSYNFYYPEDGVNVLYKDDKERIWVLGERAYIFDPESLSISLASSALAFPLLSEINHSRIFDITQTSSGEIIISHNNGFYRIDEKKGICKNIKTLDLDSITINIEGSTSVEEDGDFLWIGCSAGVVHYSLNNSLHEFYPTGSTHGPLDVVTTIKKDHNGRLWVGTPYGLFRYVEKGKYFYGYNVKSGLDNDHISSIEDDCAGRLWLGTYRGIICLDTENSDIRNFSVLQGLSCMQFNLNASYADDSIMYFGGTEGLNFFNPDSVLMAKPNAQIELTGMRLLTKEHQSFVPNVGSDCYVRDDEGIQLFFSIIDYTNPEDRYYQYRISGKKNIGAWNQIGNKNSIILSGLNYGNYKVEVLGKTGDSNWSSKPARLNIHVSAPFYRKKIFTLLMFSPILLLLFFLFEYRTKTLRMSNRILREKEIVAREVLVQKNLLSQRNKGIEESLQYAQRIQHAMFTSENEIKRMFPKSFILQRPKDIVSGDFYWAMKIGNRNIIAAADCTGHGVPGAFMSLIGVEFFRQIIGKQGIYDPGKILDEINRNFDIVFENEENLQMRDGMDLSLCVVDTINKKLEFAGAFNPVYIIRNGELIEIKADSIILGPDNGFNRDSFTTKTFDLEIDDMIYMFSDGYVDQFGGPEGKKFKFRRFRHLLLSIYQEDAETQKSILENSILEWKGENDQVDDIMVIGFRPVAVNTVTL